MAVDPRQVVGAFLTLSMFAMLANMIKKDHFDTMEVKLPGTSGVHLDVFPSVAEGRIETIHTANIVKGPWKQSNFLKPCWTNPGSKEGDQAKGFITFSLSHGPHYHVSQVADAVVVARYLGATLVIPDIKGTKTGNKRKFEEIYNVDKFMKSLNGVVKIVREAPNELRTVKPAPVKVPSQVTEDYISEHIEPIFRMKGNLRLKTFFPAVNMKIREKRSDMDSVRCLGMFGSLELKPEIQEVVDMMVQRLRTLSRSSNGNFIAVDLSIELLQQKSCQVSQNDNLAGRKRCYTPGEVGTFLRQIGFQSETVIYLTQSGWHESLSTLKEIFPKIYTKENIIPAEKKDKFLKSGSPGLERALDFHICSRSDVFVPAISGLFYANVAGQRIPYGKTQILVPNGSSTSTSATDYLSAFVSQKSHLAYSCFC
ncbi:hypothetical protein AMTRI_Chr12g275300 [Amborella trichopoda]